MTPPEGQERLDYLEKLIDERDRRYEARFQAFENIRLTELRAVKETNNFLVATFKEAIDKSETAQQVYNVSHNDLIRKMENQYQHMMPREEALSKFDDLKEAIAQLRESRSENIGKSGGLHSGWAYLMGGVILIATLVHLFLSIAERAR